MKRLQRKALPVSLPMASAFLRRRWPAWTRASRSFAVPPGSDLLLVLTVRELGPTVKLLSSAALVEGGTEVVVDVAVYRPGRREPDREFSIRWQDGGPGVVKGVQTLPADMAAALKAGLQARSGR